MPAHIPPVSGIIESALPYIPSPAQKYQRLAGHWRIAFFYFSSEQVPVREDPYILIRMVPGLPL